MKWKGINVMNVFFSGAIVICSVFFSLVLSLPFVFLIAFFETRVGNLMPMQCTPRPRSISRDKLAAEALKTEIKNYEVNTMILPLEFRFFFAVTLTI